MQAVNDELLKNTLASNVRRFMNQRGWSQRRLAREADEPVMNVNRLLRAENVPSAGVVSRIASALGVSVDSLFVVSQELVTTSGNSEKSLKSL